MRAPGVFHPEFIWALDNLAFKSAKYDSVQDAFTEQWRKSHAYVWGTERIMRLRGGTIV